MLIDPSRVRVFLATGSTDMRKSINTLGVLVESSLSLDLFSGSLFVFCGKNRQTVKILYWDRNGFCLWQKRLEKGRFRWPEQKEDAREITGRELSWLLEGLDISTLKPHKTLNFNFIF